MPQEKQGNLRVRDLRRERVTLPEAARILSLNVRQIRKAIDRKEIEAVSALSGKRTVRALDGLGLLCLRMRPSLKAGVRKPLYELLKRAPERESLDKPLKVMTAGTNGPSASSAVVHVSAEAAEVLAGISAVREVADLVDERGNIAGTRVEAHRIAALISGGMSVEEVLADYPNLDRRRVEAAVRYAQANPKQGRPYPSRTVKSVLRAGGGGLAAAFALAREEEGLGEDAG
jgi:ribosomal 50S subunit-associated protein YjgA (DUF615 family)